MRGTAIATAVAALLIAAPASGCGMPGHGGNAINLAGPTSLEEGRTIVPLRAGPSLRVRGAGRATLVIEGIGFDAPPGVLYEVYLQTGEGRRAPVGLINFYNQTAGYGGTSTGGAKAATQSFDATDALKALDGQANALVFEPTTGATGAGVKTQVNAGAHVRFTSAKIKLL